jgi:hypothetical protein
LVVTRSAVASPGSRRTRREHRTRKSRVQLRQALRTTPRKSAFAVLGALMGVLEVVGRGARRGLLWGLIVLLALLLDMAEKGRHLLAPLCQEALVSVRQLAEKGFGRDALLFVALLGSGLAAVAYVAVGKASLAMVCCLLAVLMGAGLLIGDERGGSQ